MNSVWFNKNSLVVRSFSGLDLLIVLMCFVVCHYIYLDDLNFTSRRLAIVIVTLATCYIVLSMVGMYRQGRALSFPVMANRLVIGWGGVVLLVSMFAFLSKIAVDISRVWFGFSMIAAFAGLFVVRVVSAFISINARSGAGSSKTPVLLVGDRTNIDEVLAEESSHALFGYEVKQSIELKESICLSSEGTEFDEFLSKLSDSIEDYRRNSTPVEEVWLAMPSSCDTSIRKIIACLRNSSVDVCVVPDQFARRLLFGRRSDVAGTVMVNVSEVSLPGSAELFKRISDKVLATLALILLAPALLVIGVLVKLESKGDILFKQKRYGIDGREIVVWKFRTMAQVPTSDGPIVQATKDDQRVTRVGRFLRKHSLDELPQFFNVLQGSMSVVGPRPHAVYHNEEFRTKIDGYMLRHKIKPGITGWAQVNGFRGETDTLEKMENRVKYDLEYIQNWTAWLDIKIVFLTVVNVFNGRNAY